MAAKNQARYRTDRPGGARRWIVSTVVAVVCFLLGAGIVYAAMRVRGHANQAAAGAFELRIGEQRYLITEDRPFQIAGPDGKTSEALLRRKNRLKFERDGISFAYPSTMRVRANSKESHTNVVIDCMDSPEIILNGYDKPAVLSVAAATFEQEMAKGMKTAGAEIVDGSEKPVTRKIGGVDRTGKAADYELHSLTIHQEIFSFETDDKVYTMVLQHHTEEAKLAKRYFEVVLETLQ